MMRYHIKLHHLPFPKLIELAERGEIPKRLALLKRHTPLCVACIFGTAQQEALAYQIQEVQSNLEARRE
jgi:hypothetical protein